MKFLIFLLLFAFINFSFNKLYPGNPGKYNAKLINEYDIICDTGNITYEINNTKIKKYFHLIKDKHIEEFGLFDENDNEIPYVTNTEYDYFIK